MKPVDYRNRWVLVTGASSGLGAEFARALAHRGANLVLTARSRDRLEQLALDLSRVNGIIARAVPADLSEPDGARSLIAAIAGLGIPIEHLISNAGFGAVGRFVDSEPGLDARMLRVNCESLVALAHYFLPQFLRQKSGGILHVASTAAYQPTPFMATYGASKAFVMSFSLALREEVAGTPVRIVTLCPGPVPTGFQEAAGVATPLPRISVLQAPQVVEAALSAYDRNHPLCVPGALNTLQTTAVKFLPRLLVSKAARFALRSRAR